MSPARNPKPTGEPLFKVKPCQFAYDDSDPYCKNCNGMEIVTDDNRTVPATECGGYQPISGEVAVAPEPIVENASQSDSLPPTINEPPIPEPVTPPTPVVQPESNVTAKTTFTDKMPPKAPKPDKVIDKPSPKVVKTVSEPQKEVESGAFFEPDSYNPVTEIGAESGVSIEIKDRYGATRWYKFVYSETRTVTPGIDIDEQRKQLWNDVNRIVDDQVEETIQALQNA